MARKALVLMARIPLINKTKTRLVGDITDEQVVALYTTFLRDINDTMHDLKNIALFVSFQNVGDKNVIRELFSDDVTLFPQEGDDLGAIQMHSIAYVQDQGFEHSILIGSDIPHLSSNDLEQGFRLLHTHTFVVGPSRDGGYYLLGMNQYIDIMRDHSIDWRGNHVLAQLLNAIQHALRSNEVPNTLRNTDVALLPSYQDIDTQEDLMEVYTLMKDNNICRHTQTQLEAIVGTL